jgi:hypothetical protein
MALDVENRADVIEVRACSKRDSGWRATAPGAIRESVFTQTGRAHPMGSDQKQSDGPDISTQASVEAPVRLQHLQESGPLTPAVCHAACAAAMITMYMACAQPTAYSQSQ